MHHSGKEQVDPVEASLGHYQALKLPALEGKAGQITPFMRLE